jgi:hypothetical protein
MCALPAIPLEVSTWFPSADKVNAEMDYTKIITKPWPWRLIIKCLKFKHISHVFLSVWTKENVKLSTFYTGKSVSGSLKKFRKFLWGLGWEVLKKEYIQNNFNLFSGLIYRNRPPWSPWSHFTWCRGHLKLRRLPKWRFKKKNPQNAQKFSLA